MELFGKQWIVEGRPTKIDEVFGGNSSCIDSQLKPFVKEHSKDGKWPRGMLLMGKFGGGKTTIAKIMAQTIVCRHKDSEGNPCGTCPDCKDIIEGKFQRDVTFVNAASLKTDNETSVDAVKKLALKSREVPFFGGERKVFIVDEVQELLRGTMKASINTLLQELERPNSKTVWIFTSMDNIKATGSTVETELGNGSGYGSSGQGGFLRRVHLFRFNPLTNSDLLRYVYDFAHRHTYQGKLLWDFMVEEGGQDFCTKGLMAIADGALGSIGMVTKMLQQCIETKTFTVDQISNVFGFVPEVKILDTTLSIAKNEKSDEAFLQISGISQQNFSTVYQIMMSEIRRAEMVRVFGRLGNLKVDKDGKSTIKTVDKNTDGPEKLSFDRALKLTQAPNYAKLKKALLELNQEGYFTVDYFKTVLLDIYS